jgi:hypothetical protein
VRSGASGRGGLSASDISYSLATNVRSQRDAISRLRESEARVLEVRQAKGHGHSRLC